MVDFPPAPQEGTFPPEGPTTLVSVIPSYLYWQYADDDDLQTFANAFNALAQVYVTWFAEVALPVYTGEQISGALLDWVALGLYGFKRPTLSSGQFRSKGPYNTFAYNTWPFNEFEIIGPSDVAVTTDDIFKRIITWNFYKGDGNRINVRWLKRRIMRFLLGEDGSAPNIDNTYPVSVTFGADGTVSVRLSSGSRTILGGALYNGFTFNSPDSVFNSLRTQYVPGPDPIPGEKILQQAIQSGVLQLPFQFNFIVTVPQGST